jgi:carboxymethylenebutenolidase
LVQESSNPVSINFQEVLAMSHTFLLFRLLVAAILILSAQLVCGTSVGAKDSAVPTSTPASKTDGSEEEQDDQSGMGDEPAAQGAKPAAQPQPGTQSFKGGGFEIIHFPSGNLNLCGALFKPKGDGPFPAIIYNHGSEQQSALGVGYGIVCRFYMKKGFVVLLPLRRGHSFAFHKQPICTSEGVLFGDRLNKLAPAGTDPHKKNELWLKEQETDNQDVVAAVDWLKKQSFVKPDMMIMSGLSFGGIQTVLASEKGLGMKAFIPFAPGAMSWKGVPELHDREKSALENAKAPVFLLQAENDYNLGPSEFLGKVLDKKGPPNRHKIYPPFDPDNGHKAGHGGFACKGADVWSTDVFAFMQEVLGPKLKIDQTADSGTDGAGQNTKKQ